MDLLTQLIKDLQLRVEKLERGTFLTKLSIPSTGYFVIKVVSSDPGSPQNNEIWINSSSNQLKWNKNGTIKAVTLS